MAFESLEPIVFEASLEQSFLDDCAMDLMIRLQDERENLWPNQIQSLEKLIEFIESGKLEGLIKQPMGAGKTRLFGEILAGINHPSLVLVPRKNLIEQTRGMLLGDKQNEGFGFFDSEILAVESMSGRAVARDLEAINEVFQSQSDFRGVILMTYQSFISERNQAVLEAIMQHVHVIISDEAHRSLGSKTQKVMKGLEGAKAEIKKETRRQSEDVLEDELTDEDLKVLDKTEDEEEAKAAELIRKKFPALHLRLTATPRLRQKEVSEAYGLEVIDWVRIQDLVEDGTLILPQLPQIGNAIYRTHEKLRINNRILQELAESGAFIMEDGRTVFEAVTMEYLEKRAENDGYLPGVAFCSTIEQAELYRQYLESLGLVAVRCTTGNEKYREGIDVSLAKELLENPKESDERVDVVVTVSQVGEGWDVPTLRAAMWMGPIRSPARFLQGNGRIMRSLLFDTIFPAKSRANTFIFEPEWEIRRVIKPDEDKPQTEAEGKSQRAKVKNDEEEGDQPLFSTRNFFERLVELDEFDPEALREIDPNLRVHEAIDLHNDDHLRILIGNVRNLIQNGQGVNLANAKFVYKEKSWGIDN